MAIDKQRSAAQDVVTREYTLNLQKLTHGRQFKKRAPQAIKAIVKMATQVMGTTDVRISKSLNEAVWTRGVKNIPRRMRVKMQRKRQEDDTKESGEKLYVVCSYVPVASFKGLHTQVLEE